MSVHKLICEKTIHKLIYEKTKANESLGQDLVKWQLKSKLKKESTHKKNNKKFSPKNSKTTKSSHLPYKNSKKFSLIRNK